MTGINNGQPEATIGEPIRFGNDLDFEIEQHPISDRLLIRDTANGKVAYIRAEDSGQIGGDGVLIKALKESKPMNDTGRTYDTIQEAEREASAWVFVPTGTYNESVEINTEGLTLQGCGYNTLIDGGTIGDAIKITEPNVTVTNFSTKTKSGSGTSYSAILSIAKNSRINNVDIKSSSGASISIYPNSTVTSCNIQDTDSIGISRNDSSILTNNTIYTGGIADIGNDTIESNNIIISSKNNGIGTSNNNNVIVGNRIINSSDKGILMAQSKDCIVANNRVSDSTNSDIFDNGTNTLLDGNLTGASN